MYRFFKNIINTLIIVLAVVGLMSLYKNNVFDNISEKMAELFSFDKDSTIEQVGDFSQVDNEFNISTAVNVLGCKTVVAKHSSSGQKMIIIDSGKKTLLTQNDLKNDTVKVKLEDLCKKYSRNSVDADNIEIIDRGYMTTYGQKVPYIKVCASSSKFPTVKYTGIISVVEEDNKNHRLIVSLNDNKHYSQLIATEFFKNVKDLNKK